MFYRARRLGLFLASGCVLAVCAIAAYYSNLPAVRASVLKRAHVELRSAHSVFEDKNSLEVEPRIRLLRRQASAGAVKAGTSFNVHTYFVADAAPSTRYALEVFLMDGDGHQVGYAQDSLEGPLILLPTTLWDGPVSITLPMRAPAWSKGPLTLMAALRGPKGRVKLAASSEVKPDEEARYPIGLVSLERSGAEFADIAPTDLNLSGYEMTFDEEFRSLSISDAEHNDGRKWYALNEQCCMMATDGAKTQMSGARDADSPFSLATPKGLNIHLRRKGDIWSSGVLTSVDSTGIGFSQQYGYFEMRAKFPMGEDTWPAFWLLNTAAKSGSMPAGEIDVVEYIANHGFARYMATTLHDWTDKSTPGLSHHQVNLPNNDFHRYGMLWTAKTMTFSFDGIVTFECPTPKIMHQPYYLLVDLGLGGGWPTEVTPGDNTLLVDYVRVYRERGAKR